MRHLCNVSIILILLIGKAVCQDFSVVLKLANNPPTGYKQEFRPRKVTSAKELQKFDYEKDTSRNVEIVQFDVGYYNIKDEMHIDPYTLRYIVPKQSLQPLSSTLIETIILGMNANMYSMNPLSFMK